MRKIYLTLTESMHLLWYNSSHRNAILCIDMQFSCTTIIHQNDRCMTFMAHQNMTT